MSLMVHPAPRMTKAPVENKAKRVGSGRHPEGAARAVDQKQGQRSSIVPMGLSIRANRAYGCHLSGRFFTNKAAVDLSGIDFVEIKKDC